MKNKMSRETKNKSIENAPPRLAEWLLARMSLYNDKHSVIEDFYDTFVKIRNTSGSRKAMWWYWSNVIRTVPEFIKILSYWNIIMLKNYLKIGIRSLIKQKLYSGISISGLALGISIFAMIALYVQYEFSFDSHHQNSKNIFRMLTEMGADGSQVPTPGPLAPVLLENYPEVKAAARMESFGQMMVSYGEKSFMDNNIFRSDSDVLKIFDFSFIYGDKNSSLDNPTNIIISKKTAYKYFKNENPIDKVLIFQKRAPFTVKGVFEDFPKNSHFDMDLIIPMKETQNWRTLNYNTYVLLDENANLEVLREKSGGIVNQYVDTDPNKKSGFTRFLFQPLSDIHLYSKAQNELAVNNNDVTFIYILLLVGVLILAISCINYVNMAIAQSGRRFKEVGMRKVLGAQKAQLLRQIIVESSLITFLSFVFAGLIVVYTLPIFNSLVGRKLELNLVYNFEFIIFTILLFGAVVLFSGGYPAKLISSLKPVNAFKGANHIAGKKNYLRTTLIVFQFAAAFILMVSTIVIKDQLYFMNNKDLGYDKEQIVILPLRSSETVNSLPALKESLVKNANIYSAAASLLLPNNITNAVPIKSKTIDDGKTRLLYFNVIDRDFLDLYGIEMNLGRNLSDKFDSDESGVFLFNEAAVSALDSELGPDPIGKDFRVIWNNVSGKTIGVFKDFNFKTLKNDIEPLLFYYCGGIKYSQYLSVKLDMNSIEGTLEYIEDQMAIFAPGFPFEYSFYDERVANDYSNERKMEQILNIFAYLTIFITCLGILGLSSYITKQKTKEIGIRKVLGASTLSLVKLISRTFVVSITISIAIAIPLVWYFMNGWLSQFVYRIDLGMTVFVISGLVLMALTLVIVSSQVIKESISNPVKSLNSD